VWSGVKDSAKDVVSRAAHMLQEWRAVNNLQQHNSQASTAIFHNNQPTVIVSNPQIHLQNSELLRWQRPHVGWWKCNVDASFSQNSRSTGWSWCIRNSDSAFIAAGTNSRRHNFTVAEGEAMAILEAIREASSRGWSNIIFKSDSKVVVDAIKANFGLKQKVLI
jgi:hypothetical protein